MPVTGRITQCRYLNTVATCSFYQLFSFKSVDFFLFIFIFIFCFCLDKVNVIF